MIRSASNNATHRGKKKAVLAYVLGFFTAVPVLLTAGNDSYVKFHAWQSIAWSFAVAGVVTQALKLLAPGLLLPWLFVILAYLLLAVIMVVTGREFRMPIIADVIDRWLVRQ